MLDFEIAFATKQLFDEMLDESYPVVTMGQLTFYPSQILKECDPIAYNEALLDFQDAVTENEDNEWTLCMHTLANFVVIQVSSFSLKKRPA